MCRRLCIVDGIGAVAREESVYIFRAANRKAAIRRLSEMARRQDQEFVNVKGEKTRWAVVSLDTVDDLTEATMQDMEVFSNITDIEPPDAAISFDARFTPEIPGPGMSGVPGSPEAKSARRSREKAIRAQTSPAKTRPKRNR